MTSASRSASAASGVGAMVAGRAGMQRMIGREAAPILRSVTTRASSASASATRALPGLVAARHAAGQDQRLLGVAQQFGRRLDQIGRRARCTTGGM